MFLTKIGLLALVSASLTLFACKPAEEKAADETATETSTETGLEATTQEAATQPTEAATQPQTLAASQPAAKPVFYQEPVSAYPEDSLLVFPEIQQAMAGEEVTGPNWTFKKETIDGADAVVVSTQATEPQNIFMYGTKIPVKEGDRLSMVFEFKPLEGFNHLVFAEVIGPAGSIKSGSVIYNMQPKTREQFTTTADGWNRVEQMVDLAGVSDVEVRFPRIPSLTGSVAIRNVEFRLVK